MIVFRMRAAADFALFFIMNSSSIGDALAYENDRACSFSKFVHIVAGQSIGNPKFRDRPCRDGQIVTGAAREWGAFLSAFICVGRG